jgi:murein DD-endopeptidase MepM/ murein hydrolase activator NlpD
MKRYQKAILISAILGLTFPFYIYADYGYFTAPLAASDTNGISSWFDHTSPEGQNDNSSTMTRYDGVQFFGVDAASSACVVGVGCYNGHGGIDFRTQGLEGKNVSAAASGTVQQVEWLNPSNHNTGFGFFVRLWHSQYNLSTLYGHTTSSIQVVNVGDQVKRGQTIAVSGCTGGCGGPHLHFQIYNADVTVTSTNSQFNHSVDPYGWSGLGTDPWSGSNGNDIGYLWTSNFATSSYINTVTSSYVMTASTTWLADQTYIVKDSLTISSTATLTIQHGAVVKFDGFAGSAYLQVDGKLDVQGTASDPVYFTSIFDDTVGGDANDDATTTTPAAGDWSTIQLDAKSTSTIKSAIIRYGGHASSPHYANVYVTGGYWPLPIKSAGGNFHRAARYLDAVKTARAEDGTGGRKIPRAPSQTTAPPPGSLLYRTGRRSLLPATPQLQMDRVPRLLLGKEMGLSCKETWPRAKPGFRTFPIFYPAGLPCLREKPSP